ncbi:DNA-binding protein [Paenibacillus macerans]|nr:DNA-binding protein [Paenibacillus macerans]
MGLEVNLLNQLRLDDLKIDSLVDLLKATYTLEDWDKMIEIADKLHLAALELEGERSTKSKACERHPTYYFGYSKLMKGLALQNKGQYNESKALVEEYSDLSWLDDGSKEAKEEVEFFKLFSKANMLAVNLLSGRLEYLDPYIQFLRDARIEELLPGILNITDAAIKHDFDIGDVLTLFEDDINKALEYYKLKRTVYLMRVFFKLSLYHFVRQQYSAAIDKTLQGLELSNILKDTFAFKKFSALFESFRKHADENQQKRYTLFMNNTLKEELSNEKSIFFDGDRIGVN